MRVLWHCGPIDSAHRCVWILRLPFGPLRQLAFVFGGEYNRRTSEGRGPSRGWPPVACREVETSRRRNSRVRTGLVDQSLTTGRAGVYGSDHAAAGLCPGAAGRAESQFDVLSGPAALVFEPDAFVSTGVPGPARALGFRGRPGALLVLAILFQGPFAALKQLFDLVGHASLVRKAARARLAREPDGLDRDRLHRRFLDGQPGMVFTQESRKADLVMLTKSRGLRRAGHGARNVRGTDATPRCGRAG